MATKRECYQNARGRLISALYQLEEALNYTKLRDLDPLRHAQHARDFTEDAIRMLRVGLALEEDDLL